MPRRRPLEARPVMPAFALHVVRSAAPRGRRASAPRRLPRQRRSHAPHVGVLVERRYLAQAQPRGLVTALQSRGCRLRIVDPQASAFRLDDHAWLDGLDVVVARGRSWELLCLLAWAEARGLRTINRRASIGAVHNKAEMAVALEAAGVPMPRTFLGPPLRLAPRRRSVPLVLKPVFGDNGAGVRLLRNGVELERVTWPDTVALAQELVESEGCEHKLYGIGDRVWAIERRALFAPEGPRRPGPGPDAVPRAEAIEATPAERALALRCRRIFGLDLYGLDCLPSANGPVVVEVNDFPNYTAVPSASERLADFVLEGACSPLEQHP